MNQLAADFLPWKEMHRNSATSNYSSKVQARSAKERRVEKRKEKTYLTGMTGLGASITASLDQMSVQMVLPSELLLAYVTLEWLQT